MNKKKETDIKFIEDVKDIIAKIIIVISSILLLGFILLLVITTGLLIPFSIMIILCMLLFWAVDRLT